MRIRSYKQYGIYEMNAKCYILNNGTEEGLQFKSWQEVTDFIEMK